VGPAPQWTPILPRNLLNIYQRDPLHRVPERTTSGLLGTVVPADMELEKLLGSRQDVTYVSAFRMFCNEDGCLTRVNEDPEGITTWDYGHLTTAGAEYLSRRLAPYIEP